ncbi:MAG: NrfD/PsrC family molybdoenzyme membrane anchor subunit [Desulfurococcaceae archaeon]
MVDLVSAISGSLASAQGIPPPWGWGTALYYWLASIASLTFIVAFTSSLLGRRNAWAVKWSIRLTGPIAVIALLVEAVELENFGAVYWIFSNLSAPVAINAASALVFIIVSLVYAFVPWAPSGLQRYVAIVLGWIAAVASVVWLLGRTSLLTSAITRPFWATSSLPAILLISSVMLGVATLVFIWSLGAVARKMNTLGDAIRLSSIVAACIPVLAFILSFQVVGALNGEETLAKSAAMIIYGTLSWVFWMGIVVGLVIPSIIYILFYTHSRA